MTQRSNYAAARRARDRAAQAAWDAVSEWVSTPTIAHGRAARIARTAFDTAQQRAAIARAKASALDDADAWWETYFDAADAYAMALAALPGEHAGALARLRAASDALPEADTSGKRAARARLAGNVSALLLLADATGLEALRPIADTPVDTLLAIAERAVVAARASLAEAERLLAHVREL